MVGATEERRERREAGTRAPRQRGSGGGRAPQESRRRRGSEQRYVGFGDEIERAICTRGERILPETFPVASHAGAATIPQTIVARRPGAVLFCTFTHVGPHVWPDGEAVEEPDRLQDKKS